MNAPLHRYHGMPPEEIEALMRAARIERAQVVGRALRALLHWPRKEKVRLAGNASPVGFAPCR